MEDFRTKERQEALDIGRTLARIDTQDLQRRISKYERLARTDRTASQIFRDIYDVVLNGHENGVGSFAYPVASRPVHQGSILYRARILAHKDEVADTAHLWEAPSFRVPAGRLNVPREPLIYTSFQSQATAASEVRMNQGNLFAMIRYRTRAAIDYAPIGEYPPNKYLSLADTKKLDLVFGFLEDIFTQRKDPNEQHIYVAPEIVVKNFFDWPADFSQAWGYRSLVAPGGYNLCFRPQMAKKKLEIENVRIGRCDRIDGRRVRFTTLKLLAPEAGATKLVQIPTDNATNDYV